MERILYVIVSEGKAAAPRMRRNRCHHFEQYGGPVYDFGSVL